MNLNWEVSDAEVTYAIIHRMDVIQQGFKDIGDAIAFIKESEKRGNYVSPWRIVATIECMSGAEILNAALPQMILQQG